MAEKAPAHDKPLDVPCCPTLEECTPCDTLDFRYRMTLRPVVGERKRVVPVEVTLHYRLTRCPGPLALGDLAYSTTIFPGETVRLFSSDRHSRFTFDSETKLSYRHETHSEEALFASGFASAMSDVNLSEDSRRSFNFDEASISGSIGGLMSLLTGVSVSGGMHSVHSVDEFSRHVSQHAESSSRHMEAATRSASSVSVGEVQNRVHSQGESEDHFESSSRAFTNANRCRAVTYFFYRINKCQTLTWELIAIDRRVDDAAAPTGIRLNEPPLHTAVGLIPRPVVATAKSRLELERQDRLSVAERAAGAIPPVSPGIGLAATLRGGVVIAAPPPVVQEPLTDALRAEALAQVDRELVERGLLEKPGGNVSPKASQRLGWKRDITLPTPGLLVRGCLDECDVCEPERHREITLDLERKALENELLKQQIALLDKSQEYRCCPEGQSEEKKS